MKRKAVLAKLTELAKKGPLFVLASEDLEIQKGEELSSFNCTDCGTHFVTANAQPFCVTCGSDDVEIEEVEVDTELPESDEEMSAVLCSACGTHNIVHDDVALALAGKMHCVTCGTDIEYPTDLISAAKDEESEEDEITEDDVKEEVEESSTKSKSKSKKEIAESEDSDFEAEEELDEEEDEITASKELKEEECDEECEEEKEEKASKKAAAEKAEADDEEKEDDAYSEDSEMDNVDEACIKLIAQASGDLELTRVGQKIVAFVGDVQVATLDKSNAGENAPIFNSETFASAIQHTAKQIGAEKALAHYNFNILSVKVPVPRLVEERASVLVEAKEKELALAVKDVRDNYRHSLQIAAAGLNKKFFRGRTNLIREALATELSALNFKNPTKMLDRVFATFSDKHHQVLFELAEDLMNKNAEVRNQLAEAVGAAAYSGDDEEESSEMSEEDASLEKRIETSGIRRKPSSQVPVKTPTPVTAGVHEIRKLTGGKLF